MMRNVSMYVARIVIVSTAWMAGMAMCAPTWAAEPAADASIRLALAAEEKLASLLQRINCERCMHGNIGSINASLSKKQSRIEASCGRMSGSPVIAIVSGVREKQASRSCADSSGEIVAGECSIFTAYLAAEMLPLRASTSLSPVVQFQSEHQYFLSNRKNVYGLKLQRKARYLIFARPIAGGVTADVKYFIDTACELDEASMAGLDLLPKR